MEHRIVQATARPDHTVALVWEDETVSVVSFADPAARGGVWEPMRDPVCFAGRRSIGEDGFTLEWPDDVDFSADSLWYRSHPEDAHRDQAAE